MARKRPARAGVPSQPMLCEVTDRNIGDMEQALRPMVAGSAEFLGEPDEDAFSSADVAEPVCGLVLDHRRSRRVGHLGR